MSVKGVAVMGTIRTLFDRFGLRRPDGRDEELARLRAELARARAAETSRDFSSMSMPVFFLLGRGRSGTTWLRTLLNSHPEILCRGEGRFFERSFKREDFEQLQLDNIPPRSLYRAILDSGYLRSWINRSVWAGGEDSDRHLNNLTRLAVEYFLAEQLSKTDKRMVGDKTPYVSAEVMSEISRICPEARVIHIIRDGRDVAVSLIHHMWNNARTEGGIYQLEPEELEKRHSYRSGFLVPPDESLFTKKRLSRIAADWSHEVGKAVADGPASLGNNYTEVRYEDLLKKPEEEARRLLRFLGADSSREVVERCVEKAGFERSTNRQRGQEDSSSRSRKGVAGDWRRAFTEEDRRVFKENAGSLLVKLGYEKDHDW